MSFVAVVTHPQAAKEHLAVGIRVHGLDLPSRFTPICSNVGSLAPWQPVKWLGGARDQPAKRRCGDCRRALLLLTRIATEWEEETGAPQLGTPPPQV